MGTKRTMAASKMTVSNAIIKTTISLAIFIFTI